MTQASTVARRTTSSAPAKIVVALKELRAKHIQGHDDREIPLKVFLQPCEIIL